MIPFNTIYADKFVLSRISFIIYKYQIVDAIYRNIMRIKRDIFIICNKRCKEQNAFQCESLCARLHIYMQMNQANKKFM